jgi:alkanesulfonate monooxygenase SsuD/methylene tetrahydromethanopterin reductase-like flavin-dependent oxidoreductase (luciferase family)
MLEEQVEIVHGLWSEDVFSFEGRYYALEECRFLPRPVQRPHPPIVIGGKGGPRIARLVARWADEFNRVGGTPEEIRSSFASVRDAVASAGREPTSVTTSFMTWFVIGRTEREWRSRVDRVRHLHGDTGPLDAYLDELRRDGIIGTVDEAIATMNAYAAAGVERFVLNDELFDDLDHIELLANDVLPHVSP